MNKKKMFITIYKKDLPRILQLRQPRTHRKKGERHMETTADVVDRALAGLMEPEGEEIN